MICPVATAPPLIDLERSALFLDFDGTLVGFADRPEGVHVAPEAVDHLARLAGRLSGALAIVTGRDIATIDTFLSPLRLPVAGVHGLAMRHGDGRIVEHDVQASDLDAIAAGMDAFAAGQEGLIVERKSKSVALHYRLSPAAGDDCREMAGRAAGRLPGYKVLEGKFVYEVRSDAADKGRAIAHFLEGAPFAGRIPVFVGDDVTDEDGFDMVNARGGLSIKVGEGETSARYRLDSPDDVVGWLEANAAQ